MAVAAQEAGLAVRSEPDSYTLLLGEFSKLDCRKLFPKTASAEYKRHFTAFLHILENPTLSPEIRELAVKKHMSSLPALADADFTGLRLDLAIEDLATGESKWVDVSVVHTTAASYVGKEFKHVLQRQAAAGVAADKKTIELLLQDPSPVVCERAAKKVEKYSRLLLIAKKQTIERKRPSCPAFVPFLLSDVGEMAPMALDLISWISQAYKTKIMATPILNGESIAELVRRFKRKLQAGLRLALADGAGAVIQSAGLPWGRAPQV